MSSLYIYFKGRRYEEAELLEILRQASGKAA